MRRPESLKCCDQSSWGQVHGDTLSIFYESITFFMFKEPDSIKAQKSKQDFALIWPWFYAYIIPLISFAWEQKQIPSLLVEIILQGSYPNQKPEQESASHAQTTAAEVTRQSWLLHSHSTFLCTFMYVVCSGTGQRRTTAEQPSLFYAWKLSSWLVFISRYTKGNENH